MGAGISDAEPEKGALTTTLDQCRARGDMQWGEDGQSVHHGEFSYYNLDKETKLCAGITHRTGSWTRNSYEEPLTHEEGDLFCAYIPTDKPAYAYAVTKRGETLAAQIVSNTTDCQAILLADGTLMAVFHTDCELTVKDQALRGTAGQCMIAKM